MGALCVASAMAGCGDAPDQTTETSETTEKNEPSLVLQSSVDMAGVDSITWLGDSITHYAGFTQYLETFFVTRFPGREWQFYNRGVAGDRVGDALLRFANDEQARVTQLTVVQLGMNDGGYRRWREETGETFEKDYRELISTIQMSGGKVLLASPTVYDVEAEWRDQLRDGEPLRTEDRGLLEYDSVVARLSGLARQVAADRSVGFVDLRSPLLKMQIEGRGRDPAFSLIPDSLHPSPDGHAIMAVTILRRGLFSPRPLSTVDLSKAQSGAWKIQAEGAELHDLVEVEQAEASPWRVSFSMTAKALPWAVPDEASAGFASARGSEFNRELLRVSDLESGSYLLSIGDIVAGAFTAEQLAEGIDVGGISGTPQRVQAAAVAEMNRERNQGPIRSRQDWQVDLKNRRAAMELMEDGEEKDAARLEFDLWSETHRQALSDLQAENEKLFRELRQAARPAELRYELRRLPEGYQPFAAE